MWGLKITFCLFLSATDTKRPVDIKKFCKRPIKVTVFSQPMYKNLSMAGARNFAKSLMKAFNQTYALKNQSMSLLECILFTGWTFSVMLKASLLLLSLIKSLLSINIKLKVRQTFLFNWVSSVAFSWYWNNLLLLFFVLKECKLGHPTIPVFLVSPLMETFPFSILIHSWTLHMTIWSTLRRLPCQSP